MGGIKGGEKIVIKEYVQINNHCHGMFLVSKDVQKPLILFLHGGPGSPEYIFFQSRITTEYLEDYFSVCYWDQRGAGASYSGNTENSLDIIVEDTIMISQYLQERFQQERIILMGHSWGTVVGTLAAAKRPDLFVCYIGISQVVNVVESEKRIFEFFKEDAANRNDRRMIKKLSKDNIEDKNFPGRRYLMKVKMPILQNTGAGITHLPYGKIEYVKRFIFFRGYSLKEKVGFVKGCVESGKRLLSDLRKVDLRSDIRRIDIPVLLIHGTHDKQVSRELMLEYLKDLKATVKIYREFEESAHSPQYEESEKFVEVVREFIDGIGNQMEDNLRA